MIEEERPRPDAYGDASGRGGTWEVWETLSKFNLVVSQSVRSLHWPLTYFGHVQT